MAIRPGMTNLIRRLRHLTEAGEADYTIGAQTYWRDEDLQDWLDDNRQNVVNAALIARPVYQDGQHIYLRYEFPRSIGNALEDVAGGAGVFRVHTSLGVDIDPAAYTFAERELALTFNQDTEGEAYYWDGFVFDLQATARAIWLAKAGHMHSAINFSSDGQKFDREALYRHCVEMSERFAGSSSTGGMARLQSTRLVRTDLAGGR